MADAARIVPAAGFWLWLLAATGAAAITAPWRSVYIRAEHLENEALLAHERVHIEQIDRDGALLFSIRYVWWLATRGYWANPYEVEAYRRAPLS